MAVLNSSAFLIAKALLVVLAIVLIAWFNRVLKNEYVWLCSAKKSGLICSFVILKRRFLTEFYQGLPDLMSFFNTLV